MGRYSSYGIATSYIIPLKELEKTIKNQLWGKSLSDFNPEDLRSLYPENIYEIHHSESYILITLKDEINGTDIYSLLKDFSFITPTKHQLTPEKVEEIGEIIKGKPISEVLEFAEKKLYEGFQLLELPYYLYTTPVPVGDKKVYTNTEIKGIMIGFSYAKVMTEDATEPYQFLTYLLRYRLKENPLSPALLAYLTV
ncbi:MAG: hypothetical protein K2G69_06795 [Muribaculaceae bacterium]|nr:hypothetical protein [Muribaculaceae bacterium]